MFPDVVETERLRLEPRTPEYVDVLTAYEHCREGAPDIDEITEHLPWDPHPHPKETHDFLERGATARSELKAAEYVVRPRAGEEGAGEIAGFTGVGVDWEKRTGTLGLWFRKPFWGRGYSRERAVALAALTFDRLDLELLAVSHSPSNENSERAIVKYVERMGGRREGTLRNWAPDDPPVDQVRYTVSQDEWLEADLEPDVSFYDDAADAPERPAST